MLNLAAIMIGACILRLPLASDLLLSVQSMELFVWAGLLVTCIVDM